MPTTVRQAFKAAGLSRKDVVRWNVTPSDAGSGVYVVSLTQSLDALDHTLIAAPLASGQFKRWLDVCSQLTLDRARPTRKGLMGRVRRFWIPDEVILYIGRASSLSSRLYDYYRTDIGARRPHSGGYFLKLLSVLDQLWIHYAPCLDPETAEHKMLRHFVENVSKEGRQALHDPDHPFPFANLEWTHRKAHGLRGTREAVRRLLTPTDKPMRSKNSSPLWSWSPALSQRPNRTQRVTAKDLEQGQIRIPPISSALTKSFFPAKQARIQVSLRGELLEVSWNPEKRPDRERSGRLRFGAKLRTSSVHANDILLVSLPKSGIPSLE